LDAPPKGGGAEFLLGRGIFARGKEQPFTVQNGKSPGEGEWGRGPGGPGLVSKQTSDKKKRNDCRLVRQGGSLPGPGGGGGAWHPHGGWGAGRFKTVPEVGGAGFRKGKGKKGGMFWLLPTPAAKMPCFWLMGGGKPIVGKVFPARGAIEDVFEKAASLLLRDD